MRINGYAILINCFERQLSNFIGNEILTVNFGPNWKEGVPQGVFVKAAENARKNEASWEKSTNISDFLEYTEFPHLKEITIYKDNFKTALNFYGKHTKEEVLQHMDLLISLRNKIAHPSRYFSVSDLEDLIYSVRFLSRGDSAKNVNDYIINEEYTNLTEIPSSFLMDEDEFFCINNLPIPDYQIDGGFVGRENDRKTLLRIIYLNQDRIFTITGGGGVGKTAFALNLAHAILEDEQNPFEAIVWFSAKSNRLSAKNGIVDIEPQITNADQLIIDILEVIRPESKDIINMMKDSRNLTETLYELFRKDRHLLIVDNLETIVNDPDLVEFIKKVPRPSNVLITSRKGLGQSEQPYALKELEDKEALKLFRYVAREKGLSGLLKLKDETVLELVNKVQNYPLAIKWALGKVTLGKDLEDAFTLSLKGDSDIARFSFDDVFNLLDANARKCLYGIWFFGQNPPSKALLGFLIDLDGDPLEECIDELVKSSFIFPIFSEQAGTTKTGYSMLSLTREYVQTRLDEEEEIKNELINRWDTTKRQIEQKEKVASEYAQSAVNLGIKTDEDRLSYNLTRAAKNYTKNGDDAKARETFQKAVEASRTFTYAYVEFAKYEFENGHHQNADELLKEISQRDPKNVHIWFTWGYMKRKQSELKLAEQYLLRAFELDPKNPATLNELGRTLTFSGKYESAKDYLEQAKEPEGFQNNRHRIITLYYLSDNARRWSEQFFLRKNPGEGLKKLTQALSYIDEAINIDEYNKKNYDFKLRISVLLGEKLAELKRVDESKKQLEMCIKPKTISNVRFDPPRDVKCAAYYHLSKLGIDHHIFKPNEISNLIGRGLSSCTDDSPYYDRLGALSDRFDKEKEIIFGSVLYFNEIRKFGMIEANKVNYIFFPNCFKYFVSNLGDIAGKEVKFRAVSNDKKDGNLKAVRIEFV